MRRKKEKKEKEEETDVQDRLRRKEATPSLRKIFKERGKRRGTGGGGGGVCEAKRWGEERNYGMPQAEDLGVGFRSWGHVGIERGR